MARMSFLEVQDHLVLEGQEIQSGPTRRQGRSQLGQSKRGRKDQEKKAKEAYKIAMGETVKGNTKTAAKVLFSIEDEGLRAEVKDMIEAQQAGDQKARKDVTTILEGNGGSLYSRWNLTVNGRSIQHGLPQPADLKPAAGPRQEP